MGGSERSDDPPDLRPPPPRGLPSVAVVLGVAAVVAGIVVATFVLILGLLLVATGVTLLLAGAVGRWNRRRATGRT